MRWRQPQCQLKGQGCQNVQAQGRYRDQSRPVVLKSCRELALMQRERAACVVNEEKQWSIKVTISLPCHDRNTNVQVQEERLPKMGNATECVNTTIRSPILWKKKIFGISERCRISQSQQVTLVYQPHVTLVCERCWSRSGQEEMVTLVQGQEEIITLVLGQEESLLISLSQRVIGLFQSLSTAKPNNICHTNRARPGLTMYARVQAR